MPRLIGPISNQLGITPSIHDNAPLGSTKLTTTEWVTAQNYAVNSTVIHAGSTETLTGQKIFTINPIINTSTKSSYILTSADVTGATKWAAPLESRLFCQGRLTITSTDPLNRNNVEHCNIVFYTPFDGNYIGLYDGTSQWDLVYFNETAIPLNIGSINLAGSLYDAFAYNNNGVLAIELVQWLTCSGSGGVGFGIANVRNIPLTMQDGIYVKSTDTTRRYLGTFRVAPGCIVYDSPTNREIWNYYNRIQKNCAVYERQAIAWVCQNNTVWRQVCGQPLYPTPNCFNSGYTLNLGHPTNAGNPANQIAVVVGVKESCIHVRAFMLGILNDNETLICTGIGYGTIYPMSDTGGRIGQFSYSQPCIGASLIHCTDIGYQTYIWLEMMVNPNTHECGSGNQYPYINASVYGPYALGTGWPGTYFNIGPGAGSAGVSGMTAQFYC